jgi:hypothetical protein
MMDLYNERGDSFHFSSSMWNRVLYLAGVYGWKPSGTLSPEDESLTSWDGGYGVNEGQRVSEDDALAWAQALEKALPDISDEFQIPFPHVEKSGREILLEELSGPNKEHLVQFIAFCKRGAFSIN